MHQPPRHPHAWWPALLISQALVAVLWWWLGWRWGLPLMLASHALLWWGVLAPGSALYGPVLRRLPLAHDDRRVWLTIDDGPSADTLPILDLLHAHGARATFFLVGERAAAQPRLVREILRRGHGIGNHSQRHLQARFWALGPREMAREIEQAQASLTAAAGQSPRWFRAVVGMSNPFVHAPLKRLGLARVGWSARGFDGVRADPQQVVDRIERALAPGAIVLLHEGASHGRNLQTIALLLQRMQASGWGTVLPEELSGERAAPVVPAAGPHGA